MHSLIGINVYQGGLTGDPLKLLGQIPVETLIGTRGIMRICNNQAETVESLIDSAVWTASRNGSRVTRLAWKDSRRTMLVIYAHGVV